MDDYWKIILGAVAGLLAFIAGLLAWRQQLLDKRRFEVAEQVLLTFSNVKDGIRVLRQRNSYDGMREHIKVDPANHYRYHMATREWQYGIPKEKQQAFNEVFKHLAPARVLARLYLNEDIGRCLDQISLCYSLVLDASRRLPALDPYPSVDPHNEEPPPEQDYMPEDDELTNEQQQVVEKQLFPIRFGPEFFDQDDPIAKRIREAEAKLHLLCAPYTDLNPYQFLKRLLLSLFPARKPKATPRRAGRLAREADPTIPQ
jgi:hypothetical protein